MAQLFGKNYQETGKSSSPLLLRSNGEIKLQWGNKFIDLVKNGKINSESKQFIQTIDSSDNIQDNGIYLVTSDNSIWIYVEGVKTQISNSENNYISFLTKQELTTEQKDIALTNIGLYYDTLDQANQAQIQAGLIYIKDTNKLYLVSKGTIAEYQVAASLPSTGEFEELIIGNLNIKNNIINGNQLSLTINNTPYIQLQNNTILCSFDLIANTIKSSNYNGNSSGYSIYQSSGKSILDIDSINWRNIDNELPQAIKSYVKYTILGEFNVVTSVIEKRGNSEDDINYELNLKYPNTFKEGYILAELETTYNVFLLITDVTEGDKTYFTLNKSFPKNAQLKVIFSDNTEKNYISNKDNKYAYDKNLTIQSANFIVNSTNVTYYVDINTTSKHLITPVELQILSTGDKTITVSADSQLSSDLLKASQLKIYQARVPQFIQGEGFLALRKWDFTNNKYVYHTIIGTYKESEFGISDDTSDKFGLYSDDIKVTGISLSGAKFSGQLPSFTEVKPDTIENNQFPTMEIVNEKIKKAVDDVGNTNILLINKNSLPKGSIIMFNSIQKIPDGWHICDGTNGTPNLIDKFIKAGTTLGEESVELTKYTNSTTETTPPEENTSKEGVIDENNSGETTPEQPKEDNKYKLNAYSLIFIMKYKDLD